MNREEILAMKPGRELDTLVAEKVFGWTWCDLGYGLEGLVPSADSKLAKRIERFAIIPSYDEKGYLHGMPEYSSDIATVWEVVEKFKGYIYLFQWECWIDGKWEAKLVRDNDRKFYGEGETAPEAISKAALLAVLGGEQ